jgi:hypothetical protein
MDPSGAARIVVPGSHPRAHSGCSASGMVALLKDRRAAPHGVCHCRVVSALPRPTPLVVLRLGRAVLTASGLSEPREAVQAREDAGSLLSVPVLVRRWHWAGLRRVTSGVPSSPLAMTSCVVIGLRVARSTHLPLLATPAVCPDLGRVSSGLSRVRPDPPTASRRSPSHRGFLARGEKPRSRQKPPSSYMNDTRVKTKTGTSRVNACGSTRTF